MYYVEYIPINRSATIGQSGDTDGYFNRLLFYKSKRFCFIGRFSGGIDVSGVKGLSFFKAYKTVNIFLNLADV